MDASWKQQFLSLHELMSFIRVSTLCVCQEWHWYPSKCEKYESKDGFISKIDPCICWIEIEIGQYWNSRERAKNSIGSGSELIHHKGAPSIIQKIDICHPLPITRDVLHSDQYSSKEYQSYDITCTKDHPPFEVWRYCCSKVCQGHGNPNHHIMHEPEACPGSR